MKAKTSGKGSRPVHVRYYLAADAYADDWLTMGHCKREEGVLRNAFVHIALGRYAKANVYRDGQLVFTIKQDKDGWPRASWGPHVLGHLRPDGTISYSTRE